MKLLNQLKMETSNNVANLCCKVGLYSLYVGIFAIIHGLFMAFYINSFIPIVIGIVVFIFSYMVSLKLLIQAENIEIQSSIDFLLAYIEENTKIKK